MVDQATFSFTYLILDVSDDVKGVEQRLSEFSVEVKSINGIEAYKNYIEQFTDANKRIILIVSGAFGLQLRSIAQGFENSLIHSVYIYCKNKGAHERWASQIDKIKAVFTEQDKLIENIRKNHSLEKTDNQSTTVTEALPTDTVVSLNPVTIVENPNETPTVENENFTIKVLLSFEDKLDYSIFRVLHDVFNHVPPQEGEDTSFAGIVQMQFPNNPQISNIVTEFARLYSRDQPIKWIHRHPCFSRFLASSLTSADPISFSICGFLFRDLQKQFNRCRFTSDQQLFCGQICSTQQADELKANQGKYATLLSFASATTDRNMATAVLDSNSQTNGSISVLFIITVNSQKNDLFRCATWNTRSQTSNENSHKVIFMLGSFFRIDKVKFINQTRIDVCLTSCAYEDEGPNRQLYDQYKKMYITNNSCSSLLFSCLVLHLGMKLDRQNFIDHGETFINNITMATVEKNVEVYDAQALIASHNKKWDETIDACQKSIDLRNKSKRLPDQSLALIHQLLAQALQAKGKFSESIEHLQQGMVVLKKASTDNYDDDWQMLPFCQMMASVYEKENKMKDAAGFLHRALSIAIRDEMFSERELCQIYDHLARLQIIDGQYQLAVGFFLKTLAILEKSSTSNSVKIGDCHIRLGELYRNMQDVHKAREHFKRSFDIFEQIEPPGSIKIMEIDTLIDQCNCHIVDANRSV